MNETDQHQVQRVSRHIRCSEEKIKVKQAKVHGHMQSGDPVINNQSLVVVVLTDDFEDRQNTRELGKRTQNSDHNCLLVIYWFVLTVKDEANLAVFTFDLASDQQIFYIV